MPSTGCFTVALSRLIEGDLVSFRKDGHSRNRVRRVLSATGRGDNRTYQLSSACKSSSGHGLSRYFVTLTAAELASAGYSFLS